MDKDKKCYALLIIDNFIMQHKSIQSFTYKIQSHCVEQIKNRSHINETPFLKCMPHISGVRFLD